jgi:glycine cleavage system H protein
MFIPSNLYYTDQHLWLRPAGRNDVYVGITDFGQKETGRIDSLEIAQEGQKKTKGEAFGIIYGSNRLLRLIMPLSGQLLIINTETRSNPRMLNSDPYHSWIALVSIVPDKATLKEELPLLLTEDQYRKQISDVF